MPLLFLYKLFLLACVVTNTQTSPALKSGPPPSLSLLPVIGFIPCFGGPHFTANLAALLHEGSSTPLYSSI